jgi:hypothetical protein
MNPRSDRKIELSLHPDLEMSDKAEEDCPVPVTFTQCHTRLSLLISNKMNLSTEYFSTALVPRNEAESMTKIEAGPPEYFYCPLSFEVMKEPVMTRWGHNFERSAIVEWIQQNGVCPLTRNPMTLKDLVINRALQDQIQDWERRSSPREAKGMPLHGSDMDLIWRDEVSANPRGRVGLPANRLRDEKSTKRRKLEVPPAA